MGATATHMSNLISSTRRSVVVGLGVTGLSAARYLVWEGRDVCVVVVEVLE